MKQILLFFLLLIPFITLFAQNYCPPADDYSYDDYTNDDSTPAAAPMMYLGEHQYRRNMNGLRALMTDLEYIAPDLHAYLLPEYRRVNGRHDLASTAMILGGLGGGIMMIAGLGVSDEPYYPPPNSCGCPSEPQYQLTLENPELVVGGVALFLTGTLIYVSNKLNHDDLFRFSEKLNSNNQGPYMEFSARPILNFGPLSSVGLAILLEF